MKIFVVYIIAQVNVYFNHSVDTSYRGAFLPASGDMRLDSLFIHRISQSSHSIDLCLYSFGRRGGIDLIAKVIVDSLISTKNKGVKIRMIIEMANERNNPYIQRIRNSGIQVINDRTAGNPLMHNKFVIFDGRDTIPSNNWVWTGSYNPTYYGTIENSNDVVELQDEALAEAFTREFNIMWGDTGDTSPNTGRFSQYKWDNPAWLPCTHYMDYSVYFSPSDSTKMAVIDAVRTVNYSIYFCIYVFTRQDLCDAIKVKADSGVVVRGVFDMEWWNYHHEYTCSKSYDMRGDSVWYQGELINNPWSTPAPIYPDSVSGKLHHKYMIVDAEYPNSNPVVITGTQNWSKAGWYRNDENILVIRSSYVANQYLQHFIARYNEAGGNYVHPDSISTIKDLPGGVNFYCYPNPFTRSVSIRLESTSHRLDGGNIKITIYDLCGRRIDEFYPNKQLTLVWDGSELQSGVYFVRLGYSKESKVKKLVKL